MIVYELACEHAHRFEGWFASSEEFTRQQERSLVRCPLCDSAAVKRLPSARVSVGKSSPPPVTAPVPSPADVPAEAPRQDVAAGIPAEVLAKLREIVRSTENVGRRFPEEARRIHYEEAPARAIRGQASPEEAEALRDEGIDFAPLPPFLSDESH